MKQLTAFRTEVEAGTTIHRIDNAGKVAYDPFGYWWCGPGLDNCYPSFEALCAAVEDTDLPIWTTEEPILHDCPHCGGAHYTRQVCPLAPQAEQAQQEYEDTRKYMEHHSTGGD